MTIVLTLSPGVELHLGEHGAGRLFDQLQAQLSEGLRHPQILDDGHPLWARNSGGSGHDGRDWTDTDGQLAEAFYAQLKGKAKLFFDLLLDRPGQQLTVDDLVASSAGAFTSSYSVAVAVNGLRLPHEASDRRYPFCWWEGSPTRYAVKPSVAALFNRARSIQEAS